MKIKTAAHLFCGALVLLLLSPVSAQPLNDRVLVVYNSNHPESLDVATHYRIARSIPSANLCAISPPSLTSLTEAQYDALVKAPVRDCLDAVGRRHILYIVMSWGTPYKVAVQSRTFAVDSALADVWDEVAAVFAPFPDVPKATNPFYADVQTLGNVYLPFVPLSSYRANLATKTVYSVWRLDAPTSSLAKGLVNKGIQAESSGLAGVGCFDRNRGNISLQGDVSYFSTDWELTRAAQFAAQAGFNVIEDPNWAEFGTAPAPPSCDAAALYAGWYSYNNYPNAFTWNTGAIGFHIDSASALDPRGGTNFTSRAVQDGITITGGAVNEPYTAGLVHPDVFYRSLFEGANVGDAMLRSLAWMKWMVLSIGDPLYRPFPAGRAPFNVPRAEDGLHLSRTGVLGGSPVTATVFLSSPAPTGGAVVTLTSAVPAVAITPATATVPAGQRSASFPISTVQPSVDNVVRIDAAYAGVVRRNSLTVVPLLGSIAQLDPSSTTGGIPRRFRVNLNGPAPAGGVTVSLTSNNAAAAPPVSLSIAAGQFSALLTVPTTSVSTSTSVTISATYNQTTRSSTFNLLPPAAASVSVSPASVNGPGTATGTVTLTANAPAGGTTVTLVSNSAAAQVPGSLVVPVGVKTASFTLNIGAVGTSTQVTITAQAGGASRSATFTVVTALTLKLSAVRVMSGAKPTLTLTLGAPAPAGGSSFSLSSSKPTVLTLPATATIPAGSTSTVATLQTSTVPNETSVDVTVVSQAASQFATLKVVPVLISSVYIPLTIKGGSAVFGDVYLGAITPGSVVLPATSSNPQVTVPSQVQIPAGTSWVKFPITTPVVTSNITFSITFTGPYNTVVSKVITVTP